MMNLLALLVWNLYNQYGNVRRFHNDNLNVPANGSWQFTKTPWMIKPAVVAANYRVPFR